MTSANSHTSHAADRAERRPRCQTPQRDSALVEFTTVEPLDVLEAKLRVPVVRPGSVSRTPLVNRLRASRSLPVVTVLAPAGYGKTTVLAQWADRDRRPFAWVSVDENDDDPVILSSYVASALSRALPDDPAVFDALEPRRRSAPRARQLLAAALASAPHPLVLVLDNVHLLRSRKSVETVAALAEHVPDQSTLVLAGRRLPRLPIARMRAAGRLFEVGVDELALSRREVGLMVSRLGVELEASELAELTRQTEGWAAGTYLAALSLKDGRAGSGRGPRGGRGDDRFVVEYFDFEHLSRVGPEDVQFLTRTAVLDRMCGPLCDAVLESNGSASKLESLARANLFVVSLDRQRSWYRYHREFRDFLRAELERREPELVAELHARAAAWCESNGAPEAAIPHARVAGDSAGLARLVGKLALPMCSMGLATTVEAWLDWFDQERRLEQHPTVAVLGAWVYLLRGRPAAAKRWLGAAERGRVKGVLPDGSRSLEPWLAVLRAAMCRDGVEQMRIDAESAVRGLGASSAWRPTALLLLGVAQLLLGEDDCGDESLADAAEAAESIGATDTRIVALVERSLLATARDDEAAAEALVVEARALVDDGRLGEHPLSAIAFAASARHGLRNGDLIGGREDLMKASAFGPQLTYALPWYAVQTSLVLGRADLALLDAPGTQARLSAAAEILRRRPRLGILGMQADTLRDEAARVAGLREDRAPMLTTAELRLLPLLTTHLSFREIAERLYVSRNTVKTQAISVYRKLDASSRSEAIAKAVQLGLVDAAESSPGEFTLSG
jgi:LuxR family transcriptional regulator, maltose regulon positive regulatory protein